MRAGQGAEEYLGPGRIWRLQCRCMWEGQRAGSAARRVCDGLGAGGGLDWRRGLEGRSRGTCSRGQLKFLKDDLVLENSARSCRRVADPGALAVWGGEWVPPNRVVATAAQTQDSAFLVARQPGPLHCNLFCLVSFV